MPKFELKTVQKELEKGMAWPVYWLCGSESWKVRETARWIREAVLGKTSTSGWGGQESLNGSEVDAVTIVEAAQSLMLGAATKLVVVRDAHLVETPERLTELMGPPRKVEELSSVCVFISKELDGRKKFSKVLVEKTAVIPCEPVHESQRENWIHFLAKKKELNLDPTLVMRLVSLDSWTLDQVERELEKLVLAKMDPEVLLGGSELPGGTDAFLEAFFQRDLNRALPFVSLFADQPDQSLPLLGLMGWNVRKLAIYLAELKNSAGSAQALKINPFFLERLKKWSAIWSMDDILALQEDLCEIDFKTKQSPLMPLGMWTGLVTKHCSASSGR